VISPDVCLAAPVPEPDREALALAGMASAGAAAAALTASLDLPDVAAAPLTIAAAGGAAVLPYLERARGHLEEQYPPSYAPKALALAAAALGPTAAVQASNRSGAAGWTLGLLTQAGAALSLAAVTSGQDYFLRVEEYKGFNLDWAVPLASAALTLEQPAARWMALALIAGMWAAAQQRGLDPLAQVDPAHAEGHTHHLSAAQRRMGDARLAFGLRPARKWAGLGAFGTALSVALASRDQKGLASLAAMLGAVGGALGLAGFRRPERALAITLREAGASFGIGVVLGGLVLLFGRLTTDD
jgi:hypothetical protein